MSTNLKVLFCDEFASLVINDYVWMNTVAVGESFVAVFIAGVFFQTIFQFDTTYPLSLPNGKQNGFSKKLFVI